MTLSERISSGDISQEVVEAVAEAICYSRYNEPLMSQEYISPREREGCIRDANAAITALLRALGE